jgi:alkane 1-monooxygenase
MPEAPAMLGGYMFTLLVAMLPPLWHRWMTPRLLQWDAQHANAAERELARQAGGFMSRGDERSHLRKN